MIFSLWIFKLLATAILWNGLADGGVRRVKMGVYWGAGIDAQNYCGLTPLHVAVGYNLWDIVRFLLHQGAQKDLHDTRNDTVLDYALKEKNDKILLCLLFKQAHSYRLRSEYLTEETKNIFSLFRIYSSSHAEKNDRLCILLTSDALQKILYPEKKYDEIGFGLRNSDFRGIEYCIQKKLFAIEDILMAIAEDQQLSKFLLRYLAHVNVEEWNPRDVYEHAKKHKNVGFMNEFKKYSDYYTTLHETKLRGDHVIQKILSYVNCDSEE